MDSVAPTAASTGDDEVDGTIRTARAARAEKPMMIYITSDEGTDKYTRKLEDVVFANEQLAIGTRFFETIKVSNGNALQDRMLREAGRSAPRIVFLTRRYKVHAVLQKSQLSAGKLLKAMKLLVKKEYKNSFETLVRDYSKLLNELDRLEGKKAQLADMRARLQANPSPSKQRKLERGEKAYERDMEDWLAREKTCTDIKPKSGKKEGKKAEA